MFLLIFFFFYLEKHIVTKLLHKLKTWCVPGKVLLSVMWTCEPEDVEINLRVQKRHTFLLLKPKKTPLDLPSHLPVWQQNLPNLSQTPPAHALFFFVFFFCRVWTKKSHSVNWFSPLLKYHKDFWPTSTETVILLVLAWAFINICPISNTNTNTKTVAKICNYI